MGGIPLRLVFMALMASAYAGSWQDLLPADTVITLQRKACERRCAVYQVVIFADGTVIYNGQNYVRRTGLVLSKVEPDEVKALVEAFKAINYFNLTTEGTGGAGCGSLQSDEPFAITSIVTGGRGKSVVHDHRCTAPVPRQLTALEDKIDQVAGTTRWIR